MSEHSRRRQVVLVLCAGLATATVVGALPLAAGGAPGQGGVPAISIADAEATHGQTGYVTMSFPVTLSEASTSTVTVDYATQAAPGQPNGAELNEDFLAATGTLTFGPGETQKSVDVTLLPEPGIQVEPDETFAVQLSNPVNATIERGMAVGTIHFDGRPKAGQVNVKSVGGGGQCVRFVGGSRCVLLTKERQVRISRIKYVNPRRGTVYLQTLAGRARFRGAAFDLSETRVGKKRHHALVLALVGGNFTACHKRGLAVHSGARSLALADRKKQPVRRLFGHAKGHFRTKGRYSAGTVRGTYWVTTDFCDGTLTYVGSGVVSVHDYVLNKDVLVRAGHSYLASPAKKKQS